MNEIQNSFFEAMKAFTNAAAANSDSAITVQGTVSSIVDAGIGEYSIDYLGNTFSAYANSNVSYSVGDVVYIIVPEGDFSKNKIILGLVNPSSSTFVNDADNDKIYYEISDNLIDRDFGIIKMSSYGTTNISSQNITNLSYTNFNKVMKEYFDKYRAFSLSFMAQTSMAVDQQNSGNYGVNIQIPLLELVIKEKEPEYVPFWKTITLDVGNMLGNPYRLTEWSPQSVYFTIDEQYQYNPEEVPKISYFCYGFNQDKTKEDIKDIWIKDISFNVIDEISDEDTSGYNLTLKASQGVYFSTNYDTTKTITPTLRVNGKTTSIKKAEIYWFVEDASVRENNKNYSPYGGYGWSCLNKKTNVAMNEDGTETYDYVTDAETLAIEQREVGTSARYKCVIIHNKVQTEATIVLKNLDATKIFDLKPTNGSGIFIKDTGYVNLTATTYIRGVTETEDNKVKIAYSWMRYDKNGNFIKDDDDFFNLISYNKLVKKEVNGPVSCYETQVEFPVNKLEEVNNVFCSARYIDIQNGQVVEELVGTASTLISTSEDFEYNLTINNGNQLYKYDANGNSPAGSMYNGPSDSKILSIPALTYTLRKANGEELTREEYCYVKYTWIVPKNSLFSIKNYSREDENNYYLEGYDTYSHTASLNYTIANRYSMTKANKRIILKIEFQGKTFEREVPISFVKEGIAGTNGTSYAAELVAGGVSASTSDPYGTLMENGVAKKLKFVYNINSGELYRHDYILNTLVNWKNEQRRIYPKVCYNGEIISNNNYDVEFEMFDKETTDPCFEIENIDGSNGALLRLSKIPSFSGDYCNILQAKITPKNQGSVTDANEILYCYYPIELLLTDFDLEVFPSIDGGFSEVMYAADGTNPQWDETSEFTCKNNALPSEDLSEYFIINWYIQNHFSPEAGTGETFRTKPDNKYDDGNSLNLMKTTLMFNWGKTNELEEKIEKATTDIERCQEQIEVYHKNLDYLKEFSFSCDISKWNRNLDEIRVLLNNQTNAAYRLNSLLENSLVKIDNYINTQYNYNRRNIKEACAELISKVAELKQKKERALTQIKKLNGTEGYDFNNLISLSENIIELSAEEKNRQKELLGLDSSIAIQLMVDDINRQINEYQREYDSLMSLSSNGYEAIYRKIQMDIQKMCERIPDDALPEYVELKRCCLGYLHKFNNLTSIKDIKQCIEDMYNHILRGTFYLNGGFLDISAATEKSFLDRIQGLENEIYALNKRIYNYQKILSTRDKSIVNYRPIVLYFNRYEMSNINAWDGNKTKVDNGYILTPQVGAGFKENDNSFTGVVMGLKKIDGNNTRKGLYGYHKGAQSFVLDAENGAALFGKSGTGQIVIDPSTESALLYSSNYWTSYSNITGLPSSYENVNTSNRGMLIKLDEGHIHLGSAADGKIYSGQHTTLDSTKNGFYLSHDGMSISSSSGGRFVLKTDNGDPQIYSGQHTTLDSTKNGFYLGSDGLSIGDCIEANVANNAVYVGKRSSKKKWTISGDENNSYISYGTAGRDNSVYIGTNSLTMGSKFYVDNTGIARIGSGAVANTGKHWTINANGTESYISYNTTTFGDTRGVYIGTDGVRLKNKFSVDSEGSLLSKLGLIGGWVIGENTLTAGNITLNSNGSMSGGTGNNTWTIGTNGQATFNHITANRGGSIGGWTIGENSLVGEADSDGNRISINANGSISAPHWSIARNGQATFSDVNITSAQGKTSYIGGIAIGNGLSTKNYGANSGYCIDDQGNATFRGNVSIGTGNNSVTMENGSLSVKGNITATSGSFNGDIAAHKFNLNDGEGHYIKMGYESKHPTVSGLNLADDGINMHGHGISQCNGVGSPDGADLNITCGQNLTLEGPNLLFLKCDRGPRGIMIPRKELFGGQVSLEDYIDERIKNYHTY